VHWETVVAGSEMPEIVTEQVPTVADGAAGYT